MFPIRDNIESQIKPFITWFIIVLNVLVFLTELSVGPGHIEAFLQSYGFVPANFTAHSGLSQGTNIFSSMFLHAGWAHLIGNMWFLYIFGDNVEDRMGHIRYLLFYIITGCCAAFTQMITNPHSQIAMVGASGAISGVLGAYFLFYPRAMVLSLIPMGVYSRTVELPAVFFLGLWFLMQLFTGALPSAIQANDQSGGVAFFAHVGGFVSGLILAKLFDKGEQS